MLRAAHHEFDAPEPVAGAGLTDPRDAGFRRALPRAEMTPMGRDARQGVCAVSFESNASA